MHNRCPVCYKTDIKFIFSNYEWKSNFDYYKCEFCHHQYIFPVPTSEVLTKYFNKDYFVHPVHVRKMKILSPYAINYCDNIQSCEFLEIGCSYGCFMDEFKKVNGQIEGVENFEKASTCARDKGFSVQQMSFNNFHLSKNYDGYFMFDILDHLLDPLDFIKKIDPFLNKGSQIIMTIPNGDSIEFKLLRKYWKESSPPAHLHLFTMKSISCLFQNMGYKISELHSFQGDATGNLFFNLFDGFIRMVAFKIGMLIYGKEKYLNQKYKNNLKNKTIEEKNSLKFDFTKDLPQKVSVLFSPFSFLFRNKNNSPTIFVKAVK